MGRRSSSDPQPPWWRISLLERCAIVMFGVYLAAVGTNGMVVGRIIYRNYLRGPALAPVAIVIGVTLIIAGFVKGR